MSCILPPLQPQRVSPIVSVFLYMNIVQKCLSAFEIVFWQELEGKSTCDMIKQSFDALA